MNCIEAKEYMMKYLDGEFNDLETVQFKQHLKTCSSCKEEFTLLNEAVTVLEQSEQVEPPETFEADVMARIQELGEKQEKRSRKLLLAFMGIAAVGVAILGWFLTAALQQAGIVGILAGLWKTAGDVAGAFSRAQDLLATLSTTTSSLLQGVCQVAMVFLEDFNVVFAAVLIMLYTAYRAYGHVQHDK